MERGFDWIFQREKALVRDKVCRKCNSSGNLDVHHIIPYSKIRSNDIFNLISLCNSCHKKIENVYNRVGLTGSMKRMLLVNLWREMNG